MNADRTTIVIPRHRRPIGVHRRFGLPLKAVHYPPRELVRARRPPNPQSAPRSGHPPRYQGAHALQPVQPRYRHPPQHGRRAHRRRTTVVDALRSPPSQLPLPAHLGVGSRGPRSSRSIGVIVRRRGAVEMRGTTITHRISSFTMRRCDGPWMKMRVGEGGMGCYRAVMVNRTKHPPSPLRAWLME